jgi:hypothetical protein
MSLPWITDVDGRRYIELEKVTIIECGCVFGCLPDEFVCRPCSPRCAVYRYFVTHAAATGKPFGIDGTALRPRG